MKAPVSRRGPFAIPLEDLACVVLVCFLAMQGAIPGIAPTQALEMTGSVPSPLSTIGGILSQVAANGLIVLLLLRRPRLVLRQLLLAPLPGLLVLLAIASTCWSLDPLLTLRRSLPFALAGLFGLWFAVRFSPSRQLSILRLSMICLALGTIALVLLAPSIGMDHSPGHSTDWQGVFTQKNACGRIMVLATAALLSGERLPLRRLPALGLFLLVLVMSGSRAALVIEGAVLLVWILLLSGRNAGVRGRTILAAAALPLFLGSSLLAMLLFPQAASLLGRDVTFSGRTAIWAQVMTFIAQRPLFGYGYDAFWRGMQGPSFQVDAAVHFIVEHAHNGFLEVALELGTAGLVLFVLSWMRGVWLLWSLWCRGALERIGFPLMLLVLIVLYDLDENTLLIYNGLFWVLYVAALAGIEREMRDLRHTKSGVPHAILTTQRQLARDVADTAALEPS